MERKSFLSLLIFSSLIVSCNQIVIRGLIPTNTGSNFTIPQARTNLAAVALSSYETSLTWNNVNAATTIIIQRAPNNNNFSTVATIAGNFSAYNDSGVTGSTTYQYRVYASNGGGNSPASNTAQVATPAFPTNLLSPSDFTYLGAYPIAINELAYGTGLALHKVNGEMRFLSFFYGGHNNSNPTPLMEYKLPTTNFATNPNFGTAITGAHQTRIWWDIWRPYTIPTLAGCEVGLWLEDLGGGNERLWATYGIDYPDDVQKMYQQSVSVRTLNNDGTVSNLYGEYGFQGIGQRAIYGGVQKIPGNFQTQNNITYPYMVGWGGYTSRMAQGLTPSLGFMAVAIPDVTQYPVGNATIIPTQDFKIIADHRSGIVYNDWYENWFPGMVFTFDRGWRDTNVLNYYDGGDPRTNPSTPPTDPPLATGQWLSPAPDGRGRWVWGDTYNNTGLWIVGPNKQGFIAILAARTGRAYYMSSALYSDSVESDLHIYNPQHFSEVIQGARAPVNVQPVANKLLTPDFSSYGIPSGGVMGAVYDAENHVLWMLAPRLDGGYGSLLLAYRVNN